MEQIIMQVAPNVNDVVGVAKGISDFGMVAIAGGSFIVVGIALMWSCFMWFRSIINQMLSDNSANMKDLLKETKAQNASLNDIAEGLRPETQLRIRNLSGFAFDLSVENVCWVIKRIRKENHIKDHETETHDKVIKSLRVIHDDRNSKFDTFTFKGKQLSYYCDEKWIEQVSKVVMSELYHVDGPNNGRAFTNVQLAYNDIKTDFYAKLKEG